MQIEHWLDGSKAVPARQGWKTCVHLDAVDWRSNLRAHVGPVLHPGTFVKYMKFTHTQLAQNRAFSGINRPCRSGTPISSDGRRSPTKLRLPGAASRRRASRDCGIFAQSYAQAGAIDFFYKAKELPSALSGDRTYWLWGWHGYSGNCMIIVDNRKEVPERLWNEVEFCRKVRAETKGVGGGIFFFSPL